MAMDDRAGLKVVTTTQGSHRPDFHTSGDSSHSITGVGSTTTWPERGSTETVELDDRGKPQANASSGDVAIGRSPLPGKPTPISDDASPVNACRCRCEAPAAVASADACLAIS